MPQELRDLTRVCRDCRQPFVITKLEVLSFLNRLLEIPRRCRPCRAARRAAANIATTNTEESAREGT